jgi:hypothetical protein
VSADDDDDRIEDGLEAARRAASRVVYNERRGASQADTEVMDDASPIHVRRDLAQLARAADLSAEATLRVHYRVVHGRRLAAAALLVAVGAAGWASLAVLVALYVAWLVLA